ncbi:MAG TPA: hypothetical protein VI731_07610 [Bacteroidia bacterium]|nr:hypothetical protein [Bacteroidia bacterium]
METQRTLIEELFEKTTQYTKTSAEVYKLKAIGKSADVLSTLTARLVVFVFAALFFLILNIGVALWLGGILGRSYYGFFIVSGFYAIAGLALYIFRNRWIKTPLRNSIIIQALK